MMAGRPPSHLHRQASRARSLCQQAADRYEQADYGAARSLYEVALSLLEETPGETRADGARCLNGLGQVLMKLGEYDQAQSVVERGLAMREEVLGAEHPDTAQSLHTLGELVSDLGDHALGATLTGQALGLRERALGAGHPDTVESVKNLALMRARQGDHDGAERLLLQALSTCEENLSENHRSTASVLNGLGLLWATDGGTHDQARAAYERALAIYERLLGPSHPYTALLLNNLAALLADMDEDETARPLLERSLEAHEQLYGGKNWRTSFVLVNLADLYVKGDHEAAARPLLERALIIREQAWGARHPETVRCLRKLVATLGILQQEGDETAVMDALALYPCLVALEAKASRLDPSSRSRPSGDENMPGSHLEVDRAAERLHHLVAKLEGRLEQPPLSAAAEAELEAAQVRAQQADDCLGRGDPAAAASHLEEALALQEGVLGKQRLEHVALLRKLAGARERQGQHSAILPLMQRIADIHVEELGPEHPATALALSELMGRIAYECGPTATRPLQERIVQSMEEALGPDDPMVILARQSYERLLESMPDGEAAEAPGLTRSEKRERALAAVSGESENGLAGVEGIDWHALQHAYGPADDVPNLLRLLRSDDGALRDDAWQGLYSALCHQGDVYEATAHVVPFLIRWLASGGAPDKAGILAFLRAVAGGGPWLTSDQTWMEETLAAEGREFAEEVALAQVYVGQTCQAVSEGLETYLRCLDDSEPQVRAAAFALLCALPETASEAGPALIARLEAELDAWAKTQMVQALGVYVDENVPAGARSQYLEVLEGLTARQESGMVRAAAAVAFARLAGDATPAAAVEQLVQVLAEPRGLAADKGDEAGEDTFLESVLVEDALGALAHLSPEYRLPVLTRLLALVTVPDHAHQVAILLLDTALLGLARSVCYSGAPEATEDAVYFGKVYPPAADGVEERIYPRAEQSVDMAALTPGQRQAIEAVLACATAWTVRSNLLQIYGLPRSRHVVRKSLRRLMP